MTDPMTTNPSIPTDDHAAQHNTSIHNQKHLCAILKTDYYIDDKEIRLDDTAQERLGVQEGDQILVKNNT